MSKYVNKRRLGKSGAIPGLNRLKKIGKGVFGCIENYFKANIYYFQASIELEATELKDKATDVEEALAEVEGFLERLKDLAKEVQ